MEDIKTLVETFFSTESGQLALLIVFLPLIDWVSGIAAAFRDGTFQLDAVAAVLGKHVSRVFGIWTLLVTGWLIDTWLVPVLEIPTLTVIGVGAAGAYALETIGSISRSWGPETGPALIARDPSQPVPRS